MEALKQKLKSLYTSHKKIVNSNVQKSEKSNEGKK